MHVVEGPTAKAYAVKVAKNFQGEIVKDVFVKSRRVFISSEELIGKRFSDADSLGKNILLFFNDLAIRLHLMMFGAIHIYGINESLLKPMERARLIVVGNHRKLVVYNAPIVEIDYKRRVLEKLGRELGPDPLGSEWDKAKAIKKIIELSDQKIGVVLLNQSVIAGIGNILRNEILFRAKVHPERKIADLSTHEVERIVDFAEKLSKQFLDLKLQGKGVRELLLVYNKFSGFCKVCGGPIKFYMQEPINRKTFVCENCQK